jgi:His/Glu/Gln/Arg/opine family amino acid ABC transporter permease subunit
MDYLSRLLEGVPMTVAVTAAAFVVGAVLGLPLTMITHSRLFIVRAPGRFLVDLIRAVPPIVWLFLLFYGLAQEVVTIAAFPAAIIGLGVVSAAYMSEVYRGGLLGVRRGQWQAAAALGLSRRDVVLRIIGPQAFRIVLPGAAAWAIALLKETAAVSIIGVHDIAFQALAENQRTLNGFGIFLTAGLIYIALSIPVAVLSRRLDAGLRRRVAR